MKSTSHTIEEDHLEWVVWKDKLLKALDGQGINTKPSQYPERLLIGDAKATFNQATIDIGINTVENFNNVLLDMTKHAFLAYALYKQKRHLRRHLVNPGSMKLHSLISRLQKL